MPKRFEFCKGSGGLFARQALPFAAQKYAARAKNILQTQEFFRSESLTLLKQYAFLKAFKALWNLQAGSPIGLTRDPGRLRPGLARYHAVQ
ncbi:hypothetical protein [Pseudoruegeria sp. SHC-113]|uniref:hypothetical protein n=1 Tax=Pseudoruegeria sp. SHC-113 TaxID=2855439 RepID=UPI0021BA9AD5|nr:hypothetical protein [Pseudoruegeria sp. SHC-113]MCT8160898.1 hypothetical protein [Pseudoruegeria sp. SHC-113]